MIPRATFVLASDGAIDLAALYAGSEQELEDRAVAADDDDDVAALLDGAGGLPGEVTLPTHDHPVDPPAGGLERMSDLVHDGPYLAALALAGDDERSGHCRNSLFGFMPTGYGPSTARHDRPS